MIWSWFERHKRLGDLALVLFALATSLGALGREGRTAISVPVAFLLALPLFFRRQYPLAVLAATTVVTAIAVGPYAYNPFPAGIALFTVAARFERRLSLAAGAGALVILVPPLWADAGWGHPYLMLGRLLPFAVAWLAGDSIGIRRRYVQELEEKAERLERERESEAARAVAEEQARIARELHDVIAHNLSVMVVQAAAADDVFEKRPDRAREALRRVEATGRSALAELRQLLGDVRGDGADFAPQPGLDQLDTLVREVREAGLEVVVTIEGTPRPLPTALDLSAYRIVQEALTNTLKHAHARRADVAVRYRDAALDVEVRDDGSGNGGGSGHGLIGMRERVAVFGGSLWAGPAEEGGFAVAASFPLGNER
jgi:signal transduction histidine kinase